MATETWSPAASGSVLSIWITPVVVLPPPAVPSSVKPAVSPAADTPDPLVTSNTAFAA